VKTLAIIQARLSSTRLPRKALMSIGGKPMIRHVVDRVCQIEGVDTVVVAVPNGADAAAIYDAVVPPACVFWSVGTKEDDVLGRYERCAQSYPGHDVILRATGDCPLLDPVVAATVLSHFELVRWRLDVEFASNVAPGYRDGEDIEVFTRAALADAHRSATDAYDREHVTAWMRRNCRAITVKPTDDRSAVKTSVDTLEDLKRVRAMLEG
jgi:spore coat polysaccharide biosynthesis protein SpsF (cytidylyltransferase family)